MLPLLIESIYFRQLVHSSLLLLAASQVSEKIFENSVQLTLKTKSPTLEVHVNVIDQVVK